jgi:heavy-metal resistance protein
MKRSWFILLAGLLVGALAYGTAYFVCSAPCRQLTGSPKPELAWLQKEFQIPEAEFARITKLHEAYSTECLERCRRIEAKNAEIQSLLAATNAVTPQIETALREAALIRAECQHAMLQHFYEVSQSMPREQGRRYLDWVISRTLGSQPHSAMTFDAPVADHEPHGN